MDDTLNAFRNRHTQSAAPINSHNRSPTAQARSVLCLVLLVTSSVCVYTQGSEAPMTSEPDFPYHHAKAAASTTPALDERMLSNEPSVAEQEPVRLSESASENQTQEALPVFAEDGTAQDR